MSYTNDMKDYPKDDISCRMIGFTLGDALRIAEENGYIIDNITVTAPPKLEKSRYDESFRVLRVNTLENKRLAILICEPL